MPDLARRLQCPWAVTEAIQRGCENGARHRDLYLDDRGVASVEYLVVLTLVALVGSAAVLALGIPLVRAFRFAQLFIALPFP